MGRKEQEARGKLERQKINDESEAEEAVQQATLRAEASKIKSQAELEQTKKRQLAEITHQNQINNLELSKAQKLAEIEAAKFAEIVEAIGAETIQQIARAGPEMQAKLLGGLGLKGIMITDGNSPINMFNTAKGLIGGGMSTE